MAGEEATSFLGSRFGLRENGRWDDGENRHDDEKFTKGKAFFIHNSSWNARAGFWQSQTSSQRCANAH
jgi:hypothetical protein